MAVTLRGAILLLLPLLVPRRVLTRPPVGHGSMGRTPLPSSTPRDQSPAPPSGWAPGRPPWPHGAGGWLWPNPGRTARHTTGRRHASRGGRRPPPRLRGGGQDLGPTGAEATALGIWTSCCRGRPWVFPSWPPRKVLARPPASHKALMQVGVPWQAFCATRGRVPRGALAPKPPPCTSGAALSEDRAALQPRRPKTGRTARHRTGRRRTSPHG